MVGKREVRRETVQRGQRGEKEASKGKSCVCVCVFFGCFGITANRYSVGFFFFFSFGNHLVIQPKIACDMHETGGGEVCWNGSDPLRGAGR